MVELPFGIGRHHGADGLVLHRVDQRAHVDAFVQRVADAQLGHACLEAGVDIIRDAFLHKKS